MQNEKFDVQEFLTIVETLVLDERKKNVVKLGEWDLFHPSLLRKPFGFVKILY